MSIYKNTPPIVTNGLVWYSDPGNPNGYYISSSGTTAILSDFSGTNDSLVVNGTTSYVPNYGGYLSYATFYAVGGTSYSATATGLAIPAIDNLGPITWNLWINPLSTDNGVIIGKNDGNSQAGWFCLFGSSTAGVGWDGVGFQIVQSTNVRCAIPKGSYPTGVLVNVCMVWDGNLTTSPGSAIYVNGINVPISYRVNGSGTRTSDAGYPITIGHSYNGSPVGMSGGMGIAMIYNRQLSAAEVLQNYNAHKSRFNLQ
jgi:hypothetical protein